MSIILSYHLKNCPENDSCRGYKFPNIALAWDWFHRCTHYFILDGDVVKPKYLEPRVYCLNKLYQAAISNNGKGSIVAQTWVDDKGNRQLADVRASLVQ